jgi:hypothetical protein
VQKTLVRSWRKLFGEEETKQIEDKLTEGTVEENCENLVPLLKLIPGCENVNNDNTQEWIIQDEEQQVTDNDIMDLVNHAGNNDLEDNNKGPQKADRMSHSEGCCTHSSAVHQFICHLYVFTCWKKENRQVFALLMVMKICLY